MFIFKFAYRFETKELGEKEKVWSMSQRLMVGQQ
jgi:hypothetical protein